MCFGVVKMIDESQLFFEYCRDYIGQVVKFEGVVVNCEFVDLLIICKWRKELFIDKIR